MSWRTIRRYPTATKPQLNHPRLCFPITSPLFSINRRWITFCSSDLITPPLLFCRSGASMETATIFRSFNGALRTIQHSQYFPEKPLVAPISNAALKAVPISQVPAVGRILISSTVNRRGSLPPYVKASETASALTSDVPSDKNMQGPSEKKNNHKSTFPNGFEALVLEVCDETDVAELKLKVGDFEMHLKRDVGTPKAPIVPPIVSPTTAPPIPSKPMVESGAAAQPVAPQKSPAASTSPFANISSAKASKLAALEASGSNAYVLVSSPTVGSFRKGRTLKGKRQPPSCKEGDLIKEGQIVGYLDQFGNELPIKSDVAGELLKFLFDDGEAVGYGDPLVAVLPAFHGIK